MNAATPLGVDLKLTYENIQRRFSCSAKRPSWKSLSMQIKNRFNLPVDFNLGLAYVDDDNEAVVLSSDKELSQVWPVITEEDERDLDSIPPLKFTIIEIPETTVTTALRSRENGDGSATPLSLRSGQADMQPDPENDNEASIVSSDEENDSNDLPKDGDGKPDNDHKTTTLQQDIHAFIEVVKDTVQDNDKIRSAFEKLLKHGHRSPPHKKPSKPDNGDSGKDDQVNGEEEDEADFLAILYEETGKMDAMTAGIVSALLAPALMGPPPHHPHFPPPPHHGRGGPHEPHRPDGFGRHPGFPPHFGGPGRPGKHGKHHGFPHPPPPPPPHHRHHHGHGPPGRHCCQPPQPPHHRAFNFGANFGEEDQEYPSYAGMFGKFGGFAGGKGMKGYGHGRGCPYDMPPPPPPHSDMRGPGRHGPSPFGKYGPSFGRPGMRGPHSPPPPQPHAFPFGGRKAGFEFQDERPFGFGRFGGLGPQPHQHAAHQQHRHHGDHGTGRSFGGGRGRGRHARFFEEGLEEPFDMLQGDFEAMKMNEDLGESSESTSSSDSDSEVQFVPHAHAGRDQRAGGPHSGGPPPPSRSRGPPGPGVGRHQHHGHGRGSGMSHRPPPPMEGEMPPPPPESFHTRHGGHRSRRGPDDQAHGHRHGRRHERWA